MKKTLLRFALVLVPVLSLCLVALSCGMPESEYVARRPYDPSLDGWRSASWLPFCVGDRITGFAYGNGRYVAVSVSGRIGWSPDGDRWFPGVMTSTVANFNAVAFGNRIFIAVGNGGTFAISLEGEHWVVVGGMPGFGTYDISGIVWGHTPRGGYFVAVGGPRRVYGQGGNVVQTAGPRISHSVNGINWVGGVPWSSNERLNDVAFGNGRFFAVGDGGHRGWSGDPAAGWNHFGPTYPIGTSNIVSVTFGSRGNGIGIGIVFDRIYRGPYYLPYYERRRDMAIATHIDFTNFDLDLREFLFLANRVNDIAYANGYFVAAGTGAMIGFWPTAEPSRHSEHFWRALSFPDFMLWEITAVAALNGRFFVGNYDGRIGYSK